VDWQAKSFAEAGHKPCILGRGLGSPSMVHMPDGDLELEAPLKRDEAAGKKRRVRTTGDGGDDRFSVKVDPG
jgi:hypothetical protein